MKTKQRKIITGILLFAQIVFSQACGTKDDATAAATAALSAGSCSLTSSGISTCYDYTGSGFTSISGKSTCDSTTSNGVTGTYSSSSCSTTGRIGSCVVNSGSATEFTVRYLTGYSDTTAQAGCTALSGTYTSG